METLEDIEKMAAAQHMDMRTLCYLAGIHPSTTWNWKKGKTKPGAGSISRLKEALRGGLFYRENPEISSKEKSQ